MRKFNLEYVSDSFSLNYGGNPYVFLESQIRVKSGKRFGGYPDSDPGLV